MFIVFVTIDIPAVPLAVTGAHKAPEVLQDCQLRGSDLQCDTASPQAGERSRDMCQGRADERGNVNNAEGAHTSGPNLATMAPLLFGQR